MQTVTERRAAASPEMQRKLEITRETLPGEQIRTIRCPNCGFYLLDVYGRDHCFVRVKCRKCKFNETIDTALFRTVKRRKGGHRAQDETRAAAGGERR